jgi:hypothetical protein
MADLPLFAPSMQTTAPLAQMEQRMTDLERQAAAAQQAAPPLPSPGI